MDQVNFRNKQLTDEDIELIFKKGGISHLKHNDLSIYQKSLTHSSYVKETNYGNLKDLFNFETVFVDFQKESNERFEFAGDSFINNFICEYLFKRYYDKNEGFLTKLKTKIVSREYLAKFARYIRLQDYILISNHMENLNGRDFDRILEDAFEAIIYALIADGIPYLDVKTFAVTIMEECVNFSKLIFNNDNYKDRMKKYTQQHGTNLVFKEMTTLGSPLFRTYVVGCYVNNKLLSTGYGKTKKDAEHNSSLKALIDLGVVNMEEQTFIKNNRQ